MAKIRKILNTSNILVPVELSSGNTVYLPPGELIENVDVNNVFNISKFVKIDYDLQEINPLPQLPKGRKQKING